MITLVMPSLLTEIELAAANLHVLAQEAEDSNLDTLRSETANLQVLIAEARRLQRKARLVVEGGAALFTPALIEAPSHVGFCLARNISRHGMRAKAYFTVTAGQAVCVHFSSSERVKGTIISCAPDHVDVEFERAIDLQNVLPRLPMNAAEAKLSRPVRLLTHCSGELVLNSKRLPAQLQDISQQGFKVLTSAVNRGEEVRVRLPGMDEKKALVRWTRSGMAGLSFSHLLSFDELGQFGRKGAVEF